MLQKVKKQVKTLGQMMDEMFDIRERRRIIAKEDTELKEQYDALEQDLIAALDAQDTARGQGRKASASVSSTVVANKVDWAAFCAWAARTKNMQMFQQRISDPAYREYREMSGKAIPGLEDFTKRSISLRALST